MLLYTTPGVLGTAGFLVALTLAALALGTWVASERSALRRRLVGVVVAYAAAAVFAALWSSEVALRRSPLGGALAVLFLLAEPGYTIGAVFAAFVRMRRAVAVPAFFGAALGVLAAALFLIPRSHPSVIFLAAAAGVLMVALKETRRADQKMDTTGLLLNDKCAIVTGVSDRGQVGFAIARELVAAGARVCVTARTGGVGDIARDLGPAAVAAQADLLDEADVARLVTTARERLGRIDYLINVAGGLSVIKPLAETSAAEWEGEVKRNAETAFLLSKAVLPELRDRGGVIINFASPAGLRAEAQLGAYSAAKAAVVAFTRALALEEVAHGVRVNAIAPGMIDTDENRKSVPDPASIKWVTRQQVAHAVLFLVSEAGSGITGETIHVLGEGIT